MIIDDDVVQIEDDVVDNVEHIETAVLEHNKEIFDSLRQAMIEHWNEKDRKGEPCCAPGGRNRVLSLYKRSLMGFQTKILTLSDLDETKFVGPVARSKVLSCLNQLNCLY